MLRRLSGRAARPSSERRRSHGDVGRDVMQMIWRTWVPGRIDTAARRGLGGDAGIFFTLAYEVEIGSARAACCAYMAENWRRIFDGLTTANRRVSHSWWRL